MESDSDVNNAGNCELMEIKMSKPNCGCESKSKGCNSCNPTCDKGPIECWRETVNGCVVKYKKCQNVYLSMSDGMGGTVVKVFQSLVDNNADYPPDGAARSFPTWKEKDLVGGQTDTVFELVDGKINAYTIDSCGKKTLEASWDAKNTDTRWGALTSTTNAAGDVELCRVLEELQDDGSYAPQSPEVKDCFVIKADNYVVALSCVNNVPTAIMKDGTNVQGNWTCGVVPALVDNGDGTWTWTYGTQTTTIVDTDEDTTYTVEYANGSYTLVDSDGNAAGPVWTPTVDTVIQAQTPTTNANGDIVVCYDRVEVTTGNVVEANVHCITQPAVPEDGLVQDPDNNGSVWVYEHTDNQGNKVRIKGCPPEGCLPQGIEYIAKSVVGFKYTALDPNSPEFQEEITNSVGVYRRYEAFCGTLTLAVADYPCLATPGIKLGVKLSMHAQYVVDAPWARPHTVGLDLAARPKNANPNYVERPEGHILAVDPYQWGLQTTVDGAARIRSGDARGMDLSGYAQDASDDHERVIVTTGNDIVIESCFLVYTAVSYANNAVAPVETATDRVGIDMLTATVEFLTIESP